MAAAVTFSRLLCRGGGAAALSLPPGARCFGVRTSPTGEKVTHTGQVTAAAWSACVGGAPARPRVSLPTCMSVILPCWQYLDVGVGYLYLQFAALSRFCNCLYKTCFSLQVNENFAIDLIAEQPVSDVGSRVIACDGGGGALGHPKVYINLDKETKTGTCGYCGLQFRQQHH
nr:PREDICTED: NADH dehydrogenase [ubiquinone] iron-sulfur protein 6, mitochondrial [Rhinolophus sinicus]